MRITFIKPVASENGGTRVVGIYAERLLAMGHDVKVISRAPEKPTAIERLRGLMRGRPIQPPMPSRTRFLDGLGDRHIQLDYSGPLKPEDVPDADVIIATWWRTAFEVAILPPEKGAKAYFVQHHEVHDHLPYDLSAGSYYLPLRKITIADWLVKTMADLYGDTDVIKVENGVDTEKFDADPRDRNAVPTVGLMYSTTPFKGVEVSLKAIEIARTTVPDLKVIAFGASDPDKKNPLPRGAEFHKLPAEDELRDIYSRCDAWLIGSRSEGFGLPILEAMACRTPVIATRTGAAPDIIENGINGFLVDIDDANAMGRRLSDIVTQSRSEWRAMSDAAYVRARSYDWDDAARAFEAALLAIVG